VAGLDRRRRGDTEQRLSRLAAWVLLAERRGLVFGLRLPGSELPRARVTPTAARRWTAGGATWA
jgi:hypothetical protein